MRISDWSSDVCSSDLRLIAKMPTIAAMAYKYSVGQPFVYPRNDLSYTANFLNMTFSVPAEEYVIDPVVVDAMDKIFTLHADHEQNASTSTVRQIGRASCRERGCQYVEFRVVEVSLKKNKTKKTKNK